MKILRKRFTIEFVIDDASENEMKKLGYKTPKNWKERLMEHVDIHIDDKHPFFNAYVEVIEEEEIQWK